MTNPQTPPRLTPADFNALTEAQRKCLAHYATEGFLFPDVLWSERTLKTLVDAGFLERIDVGHGGGLTVPEYEMPIGVHMAWCGWCDEQLEDNEIN
jgi:hypothetical protein